MSRWIWKGDRLAWPLVIAVAYGVLAIIVADYIWRVAVMPFRSFVALSLAILILPEALLVLAGFWLARRREKSGVEPARG
jgi:predicted transporter